MPEDDPSPTDAFALLGDETRVGILRALGEAAGPLSFSTLRERVGTRDSGRFNYHLDRLVGHFVARTDEGYTLRRVGERVVVAVQSGSVTATPELGPTLVDESCPFCGAQVGVHYREERLGVFCTECAGAYSGGGPADRPSATSGPDDGSGAAGDRTAGGDGDDGGEAAVDVAEAGHLGTLFVPPAGVAARGRDADALLGAALTWSRLDTLAAATGVCPRCGAGVDASVAVCRDHASGGAAGQGLCPACGARHAVGVRFACGDCIFERAGSFGVTLLASAELRAFFAARGIDVVTPSSYTAVARALDYEETVRSVDPFTGAFTFTVDGDALTLAVDADLSVTDVTERG
jgi:DNA-binding transcriptional ArsR family regulator